jgi:hypothetical protein
MFVPGKQYVYGLHLLTQVPQRRDALNEALRQAGAPCWPELPTVRAALDEWARQAAQANPSGRWWAILEEHALRSLADDPGMGLGFLPAEALASLAVVACGAAKSDLFTGEAIQTLEQILTGNSLEVYRQGPGPQSTDPIAEVTAAARASVGLFGGALRRLLFRATEISPDLIRRAQCLTEQATQKVLSVKAGKKPAPFAEFNRLLRHLLAGEAPVPVLSSDLNELAGQIEKAGIWQELQAALAGKQRLWLDWLREPFRLAELIRKSRGKMLRLPVNDARVGAFYS